MKNAKLKNLHIVETDKVVNDLKHDKHCVTIQFPEDMEIRLNEKTNTLVFIAQDLSHFRSFESKLICAGATVREYYKEKKEIN